MLPERRIVFAGADQRMFLGQFAAPLGGVSFIGLRRDTLNHSAYRLGACQTISLSHLSGFLHMSSRKVADKIDQAIHPALARSAFLSKPHFT